MSEKSRILYIKKFLLEQTDEQHPATIADILAILERYGISANRHTVMADIKLLQESGLDIVCNGRPITCARPSSYRWGR